MSVPPDPAAASPTPTPASEPARSRRRLACGLALLLPVVLLVALVAWEAEPRPTGVEGPVAEALAARLEAAVHLPAWRATGAVRWTFAGMHRHLWDRGRGLALVEEGTRRVYLRLADQSGRAFEGGQELEGAARAGALAWAWDAWCNDSFWLNPLAKLRDAGVTREAVGEHGLLIRYASGGVTPGDAYLWVLGPDDLPTRWKMWVSIIPVPGVDATWEGWTTLATGAKVATLHRIGGLLPLELSEVKGAATLAELEPGPDPFAPLGD
ncbi:MAG: hypothetical protein AB7N76_14725 [Planctomycetota bacterium]